MLLDLLDRLYYRFCEWAERTWNWLKNFVAKVFQFIKNWFDALFDTLTDMLRTNDEAVIIDTQTDVGSEIFDAIVEHCPKTTSLNKYDRDGKVVLSVKNGNINEVKNYQANEIQNRYTDFDKDLARDGIIRMTN